MTVGNMKQLVKIRVVKKSLFLLAILVLLRNLMDACTIKTQPNNFSYQQCPQFSKEFFFKPCQRYICVERWS
jgi:hypothetical protein